MTAYLLLIPGTPMLFQGQEFASVRPFLYFADHHPDLAALVFQGRRETCAGSAVRPGRRGAARPGPGRPGDV